MAWNPRKPAQAKQQNNLFNKKAQIFPRKNKPMTAAPPTHPSNKDAAALTVAPTLGTPAASTGSGARWTCKVETTPKDPAGFTVGEVFELDCSGPAVVLKEPLQIELPKNAEHGIVLLKPVQLRENQMRYEATAYRPGDLKFQNVNVVDADGHGFVIEALEVKVQSVIKQPQKDPFGPISPLEMPWPMWPVFTALVVLAVLVGWSLIFARRRLQKKILEKNIKKFQSPLGSYAQFSKDLRAIKRNVIFSAHHDWSTVQVIDFLEKLSEAYRLFLLREFIVPATSWRIPLIVRAIKRKDRSGFEKYNHVLVRALRELDAAKSHPADLKPADCEQLAQISWQAVDLIWKTKSEGRSNKGKGAQA